MAKTLIQAASEARARGKAQSVKSKWESPEGTKFNLSGDVTKVADSALLELAAAQDEVRLNFKAETKTESGYVYKGHSEIYKGTDFKDILAATMPTTEKGKNRVKDAIAETEKNGTTVS